MTGINMKYFVMKPVGIDQYAIASRLGMLTYADEIRRENPDLAADLVTWVERENKRAQYQREQEEAE